MAKKIVRLRYEFEFDPSKLWSNKSQFDNALNKFFDSHDIDAEFVTFIGSPEIGLICLDKREEIKKPQTTLNQRKPVVIKNKR